MVETFSPETADHSLREGILPRTLSRRNHLFDAHALYSLTELVTINLVTVSEQEPRSDLLAEVWSEDGGV
jgi:hypothetical protein